jgi:hypothetical protein|tara:strand:+ start:37219 stop:39870 length:2652 start_codon:yes stop_codon:yes gene_type:complete
MTPLYKFLKNNGTSFYAFPGAAEDISASFQNTNEKMYFSKFVLLNLPQQNTITGATTSHNKVYWDFEKSFESSNNSTPVSNFSEGVVESLRNYVANHETVIRESRSDNNKYFYDTSAAQTTTEKIFFKWCKKLGLIDFETAIADDEYFPDLEEFQSNNINDDEYFQELLWKEREVIDFKTTKYDSTAGNKLQIEYSGTTNFKIGDIINIYGVSDTTIITAIPGIETPEGITSEVLEIIPPTTTEGQKVVFDVVTTISSQNETIGKSKLVYNRLVRYIGEVTGVSNVQEANRSYTEVYAQIPDYTGETPDVLFRTKFDDNYSPNLEFPLLPSQYQPEIIGSELFSSPIVNSPESYPGSYFGQFDVDNFTYTTKSGDSLRRSGDYFGVKGTVNNPVIDGSNIDGISINFNTEHYVKMNIPNNVLTTFDEFNGTEVNNEPPKDFQYNAILWYYNSETSNGQVAENLYGVSFLDNPENNENQNEVGVRFPLVKKLVANGEQDGTAYAYNLNLNFNVINDNPQDAYNPEAVNALFSMDKFNKAMGTLSSINDVFLNMLAEHGSIKQEISDLKGLLYTQTDLNTLNSRINNLDDLLKLYSTNQIIDSDSIKVGIEPGSPSNILLENVDPSYDEIKLIKTSELFNISGDIVPYNFLLPNNKNSMLHIINDDIIEIDINDDNNLSIVLSKDIDFKQSVDLFITANENSTYNKKIDIFVNKQDLSGVINPVLLIGSLDLPVYYNNNNSSLNSSYTWSDFKFEVDMTKDFYKSNNLLTIELSGDSNIIGNSILKGDSLSLNNLMLGTSSSYSDYSGQYKVSSVAGNQVVFDITPNKSLIDYDITPGNKQGILPKTQFYNIPYLSLNKGYKIKVTRISDSDDLFERYQIDIKDN